MIDADHDEQGGLTETRSGIGFAELCLALALAVLTGARSGYLVTEIGVGERREGNVTRDRASRSQKPGRELGQCESGGEWKTHRESRASFQRR